MKMKSMQSAGNNGFETAEEQSEKLALLGACCLFLSAVEYMIPKPLPFLRIGLANLPLMIALGIFPLKSFLVLISIKVLGQALITGTMFSYIFLFSAAGTFCSGLLMFALKKVFKQKISFIGIGTAGAMVSSGAQLALAYFFVFGESVRYIAPWFLGAGLITGVLLGVFVEVYVNKGKRKREKGNKKDIGNSVITQNLDVPLTSFLLPSKTPIILFITGLLTMPLIVFNPSTELRVLIFLILWLLAIILKKKTNPLFTLLFLFTIIVFNLLIPYGKVLFSIGVFNITSGALTAGIHRAVTFQALVMLSKLTIRDDLKLPGKFGKLLSESLQIFSKMMNQKINLKNKNIFEAINELLQNINK